MSRLPWDQARQQGRDGEEWIIVNIQDPSIFDCQAEASVKPVQAEFIVGDGGGCGAESGAEWRTVEGGPWKDGHGANPTLNFPSIPLDEQRVGHGHAIHGSEPKRV